MTHGSLCKAISDYLKTVPQLWFFRPNNMGYGRKGIPDFIICSKGKFYALEVKVGADKPKPWQERETTAIQLARGSAYVIMSVNDVRLLFPVDDAL